MNNYFRLIYTILVVFIFTSMGELYAQDCNVGKKFDWKLVTLEIGKYNTPQTEYEVMGEWILKRKKPKANITDLSNKERKKLKKHAARNGSCLVFVQTKVKEQYGGLYYYWVKPIKSQ